MKMCRVLLFGFGLALIGCGDDVYKGSMPELAQREIEALGNAPQMPDGGLEEPEPFEVPEVDGPDAQTMCMIKFAIGDDNGMADELSVHLYADEGPLSTNPAALAFSDGAWRIEVAIETNTAFEYWYTIERQSAAGGTFATMALNPNAPMGARANWLSIGETCADVERHDDVFVPNT